MEKTKPICRCFWVPKTNEAYIKYHDEEWGVPSYDERHLFEMLILEGFQAGLSWECVLNKREAFQTAFDGFDYQKIAEYDKNKLEELMQNPAIIRNRLKIEASVINARIFMEIQKEYGFFAKYIWHFTDGKIIKNTDGIVRSTSWLSDKISLDLKKRGMKFVGSTIIYSYLQAIGVINDHDLTCDFRDR